MQSILLICEFDKGIAFFTDFLSRSFNLVPMTARNGEEAKRLLIERDFDICIIDTPLKSTSGENLAIHIAEKNLCQVLMAVPVERFEAITEKVEDYGIITVSKPMNRTMLWNAMKLASASQRRVQLMQSENNKLTKKLEDMKLVNRAKFVLISYMGMTEEMAHRFIEKSAMDKRMTKKAVAEEIIKRYDR